MSAGRAEIAGILAERLADALARFVEMRGEDSGLGRRAGLARLAVLEFNDRMQVDGLGVLEALRATLRRDPRDG